MKKTILVLTTILIFMITGCANNSSSNKKLNANPITDFEYEYDSDTQGIIITKYIGTPITVVIPNEIEEESVTCIGESAFEDCGIKTVVIPETVEKVEESAFKGCQGLMDIDLPKNLKNIEDYAFENTGLTEIEILYATTLGDSVFSECENLTKAIIGDTVVDMGIHIFSKCPNLSEVLIGDNLNSISSYAFNKCESLAEVTLGNGIKTIGEYSFSNCKSLKEINIPNNVTEIEPRAFEECSLLQKVVVGDSVTAIGGTAFINCKSLTDVSFGKSLKEVGFSAFSGCENLTNIALPDGVSDIGPSTSTGSDGSFGGCKNIVATYRGKTYTYTTIDDLYIAINGDRYADLMVPTK